ncbi:Gti1/Pac2 family-domain-containing protein [Lentinula detonsa]|uniref:Gti1/Pac2 family-domain-containing protein n=1 Tax=Lentinula detonsa TaxID=2804962 RepID=A0AA38Q8B1_9AGAR|nr:Gti1/Pac2 family-domain-containing protein [Lentinula detonsa]
MQRATCTDIRIRSPADARVVFHAVLLNVLPMVTRRLDAEERALISPGSVYVWEERGPHGDLTGVGIERWTDGIRWGPSRVREGFLFYHEKQDHHFLYSDEARLLNNWTIMYRSPPTRNSSRTILIKQTYTVFVDTIRGQRKWHLIAYFNEDSLPHLRTVDDLPHLASLPVPHGKYKSARSTKGRPDHIFNPDQDSDFPRIEYIPYKPKSPLSVSDCSSQSSSSPDHSSITSTTLRKWMNTDSSSHQYVPSGSAQTRKRHTALGQISSEDLAPLAYLQSMPPPRRHPEDEKTLMLLASRPL